MDVKCTSVIMIYDDYWLLGTMPTREKRVLDVLKDTNSDYIQLNDVQVFRNETRVLSISQGVVAKQKLSLILIPGKDHEAPQKRSLLLMKKKVCRACVLVPGYTLQGDLHPTRIDNSLLTLTGGVADFFPITEATVAGAGIEPLQVPVAIVNKNVVAFFSVGESSPIPVGKQQADSDKLELNSTDYLGEDDVVLGLNEAANKLCAHDEKVDPTPSDPVHAQSQR